MDDASVIEPFMASTPPLCDIRPIPNGGRVRLDRDAIAARLRLLRMVSGVNQAEFCRRIDISPQAWNNYERNLNRISLEQAIKVVQGTGATLDYIYLGVDALLPAILRDRLRQAQAEEKKSA